MSVTCQLVTRHLQGLLDACIYISTIYGERDTFEDGSNPKEHAASIVRNLCGNDQIRCAKTLPFDPSSPKTVAETPL